MPANAAPRLLDFRRLDRMVDVAALQLHPPNFDRIASLSEIGLRARQPHVGTHRPGVRAWRRWLRSADAAGILATDPNAIADRPGVEAVVVSGRGVGVVPGHTRDEAVAARILGVAIDATLAEHRDDEALRRAKRELRAGLALGDAMVERARLPTAVWPQHADGHVVVPDAATLRRLRNAVTFAGCDLPLRGEPLEPLVDERAAAERGQLWRTPLTRTSEGTAITQPFALASATLAHAWATAATSLHFDEVRAAVIARWTTELNELVDLCDWHRRPSSAQDVIEIELDGGTIAALLLIVEPPAEKAGVWDASAAVASALGDLSTNEGEERLFIIVATLSFGRPPTVSLADELRAGHAWLLDAQGLQYLLEASRLDPLGLVRAHRQLPANLPREAAVELLDVFGAVRYMEDTGESVPERSDPTEIAIKTARRNARRHPAPGWDDRRQDVEVARFRLSDDERFFTPTVPDGHTRILVRDDHAVCWTSSGSPTPSPHAAEAVLAQMTAFWASRLAAVGLLGDNGGHDWTSIIVKFDPEAPDDEPLAVEMVDPWLLLHFGPELLRLLARGDNTADRVLAAALIDRAHQLETDDDRLLIARALDIVAAVGAGTFVIWNDPERHDLPPPAPDLIRTLSGARRIASVEMANAVCSRGTAGLVRDAEAKGWLDIAVDAGLQALDREVRGSAPDLLCELVRLTGLAAEEAERMSVKHPAHHALGDLPVGSVLREEHLDEPGRARVALRFLVELAHAQLRSGSARINEERLQRLRAMAEAVLEAASASDLAHSGLVDLEVLALPGQPLVIGGQGPGREARERQSDLILERAPEASFKLHPEWWDADRPAPVPRVDRPVQLRGEWGAVSEAMREDVGFGWDDFLRIARSLADAAIAAGDVTQAPRSTVIAVAATATSLRPATCATVVRFLSLERPTDYDPRKHPHKPWKTGRDTGYLRRPLLVVGDDELLWSGPHLLLSMSEIAKRLELRRLTLPGRRLRKALDKLRAAGDNDWERVLASLVAELGFEVRAHADRIGGRPVARDDGSTLGDVDVLFLQQATRTIWALDAKRIAPATAPMALPDEAERLGKEARKHEPRLRWLQDNLDAVAIEFGRSADALAGWSVRGALVVASPLGGAFIADSPVPLLTWGEMGDALGDPERR